MSDSTRRSRPVAFRSGWQCVCYHWPERSFQLGSAFQLPLGFGRAVFERVVCNECWTVSEACHESEEASSKALTVRPSILVAIDAVLLSWMASIFCISSFRALRCGLCKRTLLAHCLHDLY